MTHKHTYSLAEVERLTGIPAEEVHARIWRGELSGDGNVAMPTNRQAGFVNAETMAALEREGRQRKPAAPAPPAPWQVFQAIPLAQAAEELGITSKELERLLVQGELEGPLLNRRYTGVMHGSLTAYQNRQAVQQAVEAAQAVAPEAVAADAASQGVTVDPSFLDALKRFLTGK